MSDSSIPDARRVLRIAEGLPDRSLLDAVQGRTRSVAPTDALKELLSRDPERTRLLTDVVRNRARPADVRATAANALGTLARRSHQEALIEALADPDPDVVRDAAMSLGKIGDPAVLPQLEALRPRTDADKRRAEMAAALVSYRHHLDGHRLRSPAASSVLEVSSPRRANRLTPERPPAAVVRQVIADAAHELPAVELSQRSVVRFSCGPTQFAIVLAAELEEPSALEGLRKTKSLVGALLQRDPNSDSFFVKEYLLADPASGGTARLLGVRPAGQVVHVGEVRLDDGHFELRATDTRHSPPVAIAGMYDPRTARPDFSQLLVDAAFAATQRQPRQPTALRAALD